MIMDSSESRASLGSHSIEIILQVYIQGVAMPGSWATAAEPGSWCLADQSQLLWSRGSMCQLSHRYVHRQLIPEAL